MKEITATAVYWITGGIDRGLVGFSYINQSKPMQDLEGTVGKIVEFMSASNDDNDRKGLAAMITTE